MSYELTSAEYNNNDSERDGYPQFEASLQQHFNKAIADGKKLFVTNVENLYELYLENLPEVKPGTRQHFTCHGCRHFFERYGRLVTIDEQGIKRSAIFDEGIVPDFFVDAVIAMRHAVLTAEVSGVFVPDARVLGIPKTGEWTHVHVRLPQEMVNRNVLRTAGQVMAEKREDFHVLRRVASQHTIETVDQAIALLKSETVNRGDRYIPHAEWFKEVLVKLERAGSAESKRNVLWLAVSEAPTGFIPSNSSNVGQLLTDIAELSLAEAGEKLADRLKPSTFMRAQAAPSANALREAERTWQKLEEAGMVSKDSLKRKYAKIEQVPEMTWEPKLKVAPKPVETGSVFGHITPREKKVTAVKDNTLASKIMTWDKFQRTILPTADKIEALIDNPDRFMALITSAVEGAPNMLQWDNEFSWYYHAGVDAEIKKRVEGAGGRYENNALRVSLSWENYTDLDIHGTTPGKEHICYSNKRSNCGGQLDVDANGGRPTTRTPVENIRWARDPKNGRYRFFVHNYCERDNGKTPFKVELEVKGKTWTYHGVSGSTGWQVDVFEFDYLDGEVTHIRHAAITSDESWTADINSFVEVKGITSSPNLWGKNPVPHAGNHTFFLLEGVTDESEGRGRGFFNEHLKSEFREIRKVLEAYANSAAIEGAKEATACGLGFSKDTEWNVTLKVTTGNTTQLVKIDRWD
ncbi:hypothetical protein_gp182 [Bacillus phage vB_BceM_WH1]|nr:hypothetical protein_gp182 [Bacillus phage vB_BceM_WH1]